MHPSESVTNQACNLRVLQIPQTKQPDPHTPLQLEPMSLITQCPACGTLFKVVADQLKISQGWVRCGQCHEVFDANAQLTSVLQARAIAAVRAQDAALKTGQITLDQAPALATNLDPNTAQNTEQNGKKQPQVTIKKIAAHAESMLKNDAFLSDDWINTVNPPAPPKFDVDADAASGFAPSSAWAHSGASTYDGLPELDSPPSVFADDVLQEHARLNASAKQAVEQPVKQLVSGSTTAVKSELLAGAETLSAHTPMPTPGFVRQAQRAARWRKPWVRAGLVLTGLVLTLLLAGQIALQERARVVALLPQTQPWLQTACAQLGCKMEPLKQIESILVDASAFNKVKSSGTLDAYRLNITLKNTANVPVALPHIELTLNDTQDASVLRRVLSPAELNAPGQVLAGNGDFTGGVSLQIDNSQLGGARIAGYRVLAFYP